jgi:predicted ATPase
MRSLADVRLPLEGLTVLIGDNGSGKSTLVEAFEILRKVAQPPGSFIGSLIQIHDLDSLMANGAKELEIGISIAERGGEGAERSNSSDEPAPEAERKRIEYSFTIERQARGTFAVAREQLEYFERGARKKPLPVISRTPAGCQYLQPTESVVVRRALTRRPVRPAPLGTPESTRRYRSLSVAPDELALRVLLEDQGKRRLDLAARVQRVLSAGEVHMPFEVRARWLCQEQKWEAPLRDPIAVDRADRLERLGVNLTNAFAVLKNREDWADILNIVRLGLGPAVRDVLTVPASRGKQELQIRYADRGAVPAIGLSDGTLAYLAFVALAHLDEERSFLVIDEPELHFHPALLVRVLEMLEEAAEKSPVVLATHSDRLLDALSEPARSVVLCELGPDGQTVLRRPNKTVLDKWLEEYRGIGRLRTEAPIGLVMDAPLAPRTPSATGDR